MKALLVAAVVMGCSIPCAVHAQRGGTHGGGAVGRPGPGFNGIGGGKFGNGRIGGRNQRGGLGGFPGLGFAGYGWAPDYGWGYGGYQGLYEESWFPRQYDDSQSQSGGLMLMQAPAQPLPPPEPAHPVMQVYHWAEGGDNPQATFSIVSRDGVVRHAVAVWVQDSEVRYTAVNGAAGRMAASAIDCGASSRLNADQQLSLRLPGCRASQ